VAQRKISLVATAVLGLLGSTSAMAVESGFYLGVVGGQANIDVSKNEYDLYERDPFSSNFSSSLDDSDTSIGIVLGGQFGRWFAVEAQLINLGELSYSSSQTIPNVFATTPRNLDIRSDVSVEAAAASLSGILTIPIAEQFSIGVRLGFAANATETSYEYEERRSNSRVYYETDDNDAEASDIGATYGVSFEWDPTPHLGVRVEYQIIKNVGGEDDDYDYDDDFDFDDDEYYDDVAEQDGRDLDLISLSLVWRF
jgi:opacity protein-like surface antigen